MSDEAKKEYQKKLGKEFGANSMACGMIQPIPAIQRNIEAAHRPPVDAENTPWI